MCKGKKKDTEKQFKITPFHDYYFHVSKRYEMNIVFRINKENYMLIYYVGNELFMRHEIPFTVNYNDDKIEILAPTMIFKELKIEIKKLAKVFKKKSEEDKEIFNEWLFKQVKKYNETYKILDQNKVKEGIMKMVDAEYRHETRMKNQKTLHSKIFVHGSKEVDT